MLGLNCWLFLSAELLITWCLPQTIQVQQEVSRLQTLVADQLPQEKQRQQQRIQAISQALASPATPEVCYMLVCCHVHIN